MAHKNLKKKSTKWSCPQGCDLTKTICSHLEKELPKLNLPREYSTSSTQAYKQILEGNQEITHTEADYLNLEQKLDKLGFKDYEIELIMDRFVLGMEIGDIAKSHGYINPYTVDYLLRSLKEKLKRTYKKGGLV